MNIVNQKPVVLGPVYLENIQKDFDPRANVKSTLADKLFQPLIAGMPVTVTSGNNQITPDTVTDLITRCLGDTVDVAAEQAVKEILGQMLVSYNAKTAIGVNEFFVVQSGTAAKLPEPDANCVYAPATDVIPASRQFMSGTCDYDKYFASLAYYARPETLGFYFINEMAFNSFIQWFTTQMGMLGSAMTPDVNRLCADFGQLTLTGLTESIVVRAKDDDGNEPKSFARLIVNLLMQYTNVAGPAEFGVLPFNVGELFCPRTIVFVNVEKHSRASARQVADEWNLIRTSLQQAMRPNMISNKKLMRLTAAQRNMRKIAAMAATAAANQTQQAMRSANIKFASKRPTVVDMTRIIKKILSKMTFTNKSMNVFKSVKASFAKPNRRDPDDYNKQGKVVSTRYKPDIHLYIDTSGSISERDYEDAVKACIAMAKAMNINLYFNSFSHCMSQTTRLRLENKSKMAIYEEFRRVPKVSGGTDYEQIWTFINSSKKRTRELSIIISDFEWMARNTFVHHPKNLYYIPCSTMNWDQITKHAEEFCKSAMHNDPNIRQHVLF